MCLGETNLAAIYYLKKKDNRANIVKSEHRESSVNSKKIFIINDKRNNTITYLKKIPKTLEVLGALNLNCVNYGNNFTYKITQIPKNTAHGHSHRHI